MGKQQSTTTNVGRPPINQMSDEQLATWREATRTALQQKMQRERASLDRRAARGPHTPTDDADLLALLDEMAASLGLEGRDA